MRSISTRSRSLASSTTGAPRQPSAPGSCNVLGRDDVDGRGDPGVVGRDSVAVDTDAIVLGTAATEEAVPRTGLLSRDCGGNDAGDGVTVKAGTALDIVDVPASVGGAVAGSAVLHPAAARPTKTPIRRTRTPTFCWTSSAILWFPELALTPCPRPNG
jgi:hypothetical protein